MLARLIQEIPTVSTGLALVALFGVLIAWGYKKWLSHKERVIRGSQSGKQMEALGATLAWFKIDTTQLSSAQKYNLALAQIKAKQSQQRRLIALSLVSILLFTSLGMFAIVRVPEPTTTMATGASPGNAEPLRSTPDTLIKPDVPQPALLPFIMRLVNPTTLADQRADNGYVIISRGQNDSQVIQGEEFVLQIAESEQPEIRMTAFHDKLKLDRRILISGYVSSEAQCDRRTVYLAEPSIRLSSKLMLAATKSLEDTTRCAAIQSIGDLGFNSAVSERPSAL